MSLIKWNPSKELLNMEREFGKLFKDFENRFGFGSDRKDDNYDNAVWSPLTDIYENENEYKLQLDLPGIKKDDLKISYSDGELKISGERRYENEDKDTKYHRIERAFGKYYRSFTLPKSADYDKIKADFKDGQLKISIPKKEEAKPKEIAISVN